jgi:transcriptional regulator GlxA family with amidase domain
LNTSSLAALTPLTYELSDNFKSFAYAHVAAGKIIFTTCTGGLIIASIGVLDGKNATINDMIIPYAKTIFPKVLWTDQKQWVVDGNGQFWTAGGACADMDMMAHWVFEKYTGEVSQYEWKAVDYEPRDVRGNRMILQQHGVTTV